MAKIVLCRIDSRLIHGQVMTKWVNQSQADHIVVVSDTLSKDPFMMEIYLLAAPPGIKVECFNNTDAIEAWKSSKFGEGNVLLLLPNLSLMKTVYDGGIGVEQIQIGGLGGAPNRKVVFQNITLDEPDVEVLKYLQSKGVKIIFQTIPEDAPKELEGILKKFYAD